MSINNIIPFAKLNEAEELEIIQIFNKDVVIKYLRILGTEDAKDLLSLSILDMSDKDIANRHHHISGKLAVIATLLSISKT